METKDKNFWINLDNKIKRRNRKDFKISIEDVAGLSDGDIIEAVILPIWPSVDDWTGNYYDEMERISRGTPGRRMLFRLCKKRP